MFHKHPAVKRFHEDHSRYLGIADHHRLPDGTPRILPKVVEDYRIGLIRSLALPVLSLLIDWAWELLKDSHANGAVDQIHDAMESVDKSKFDDAIDSLEDAARAVVEDIGYESLSLAQVSSVAWLVSELGDLRERLIVRREGEYFEEAQFSIGRDQWARLAQGDCEVSRLVPVLADVYCEHGNVLGAPKDTTSEAIHQLIAEGPHPFGLVGLAIALWTASHNHLETLNDAVLKTLLSWGIGRQNKADKSVGKPQRACTC